jgi:predicted negative regulator of RcsB-dependent stress response
MPEYVAALEVKARALLHMNRPADALGMSDEALALAMEMKALPMVWRLQETRGRALLSLGQNATAQKAFAAASQTVQRLADSINDDTLKRQFLASPELASVGRKHL